MSVVRTHETEALSLLHHNIRKRQRTLLRQIAARDAKIAALRAEQDDLRRQLHNTAVECATQWACKGQNQEAAS